MRAKSNINCIKIDKSSTIPKYQQIVGSVQNGIRENQLRKGDTMPTINELSYQYGISKATIERGYGILRKMGILDSFPGKGYFIANTNATEGLKVLLLFNKLSANKEKIYNNFIHTLGEDVIVDFYVYNNDYELFKNILSEQKNNYTQYVIIPHFDDNAEGYQTLIERIPREKLVIIGKRIEGLTGDYAAVYENFEEDIYKALIKAIIPLNKYHTLKLIFPTNSYFPREIVKGFENFCHNFSFNFKIIENLDIEEISEGEVYINIMEEDLIKILDRIIKLNLRVGQQVGVISYNETPLKKFIMNGVTTISTDFAKMGITAANFILNSSKTHNENPFDLILRGSL